MNIQSLGTIIAQRRREHGLTLTEVAAQARIGRSTLAALESGKINELGFSKIARLCDVLGLVVDIRPPTLAAPLMPHRHLTDTAGRELSKAAIEDVIVRGNFEAWRGLVRAMREDTTGRIGRRVQQIARSLSRHEPRARAFATLTPRLLRRRRHRAGRRA
jgi:transcriptional regulator with XRE-family HTH domain